MKLYISLLLLLLGIISGCKKSIPRNGNNGGVVITPPPPLPTGSTGFDGCPLSSSCEYFWICMNIPNPISINYGCATKFFQAYGASASTQNKCYFAGGSDDFSNYGGSLKGGIEYDPLSNSFRTFELSVPRTFLAGATAGEKILFAGGREISHYTNNPVYNTVDIYEKQTLNHTIANLSEARANLTSVSSDSLAYFIGGKTLTGFSDKIDVYNSKSNSWNINTMPRERGFASAAIIENKIYIAGGQNNSGNLKTVDVYDIQSDSWSTLEAPNEHPFASVATANNKLIIAGGDGLQNKSADIYNTTTHQWETVKLSSSRFNITVVSVQNKVLFLGGANSFSGFSFTEESESIDIYYESTGIWTKGFFTLNVCGIMAATVGNQAFVIGFMSDNGKSINNTMIILNK